MRRLATLLPLLAAALVACSGSGSHRPSAPPEPASARDRETLAAASLIQLCGAAADHIAGLAETIARGGRPREARDAEARIAEAAGDLRATSEDTIAHLRVTQPASNEAAVIKNEGLGLLESCLELAGSASSFAATPSGEPAADGDPVHAATQLADNARTLAEEIAGFATSLQP